MIGIVNLGHKFYGKEIDLNNLDDREWIEDHLANGTIVTIAEDQEVAEEELEDDVEMVS